MLKGVTKTYRRLKSSVLFSHHLICDTFQPITIGVLACKNSLCDICAGAPRLFLGKVEGAGGAGGAGRLGPPDRYEGPKPVRGLMIASEGASKH